MPEYPPGTPYLPPAVNGVSYTHVLVAKDESEYKIAECNGCGMDQGTCNEAYKGSSSYIMVCDENCDDTLTKYGHTDQNYQCAPTGYPTTTGNIKSAFHCIRVKDYRKTIDTLTPGATGNGLVQEFSCSSYN